MYIHLGLILYCSTYECFWIYPLTVFLTSPESSEHLVIYFLSLPLDVHLSCYTGLFFSILLHVKLLPVSTQTFPWFCSLGSSPVHTQSLIYFALYELLYALSVSVPHFQLIPSFHLIWLLIPLCQWDRFC